ncbi:hypothetical protein SO802_034160 [Lithocarpus litseifolius]|uniref:Uncharacterized protein n=1 Tax=Lithocarpus litseifolius TaxID=425828 RepID=A0AAW2BF36_9ROSI
MDSKRSLSAALFISVNLLFFAIVSACYTCPSLPKPNPNPNPKPSPTTVPQSCPRDALKLGVCAKVLNGAVGTVIRSPPDTPYAAHYFQGLSTLKLLFAFALPLKPTFLASTLTFPFHLAYSSILVGRSSPLTSNVPKDFFIYIFCYNVAGTFFWFHVSCCVF